MKWGIIILVLWTLVLLGVLLSPIEEAAIPALWEFEHWDKVYHFILFAITGFVSVFGARFLNLFRSRMLFAIVFGLFLAVSTELAQSLIPCRNMSFYDLLADVVGLGVVLSLYASLHYQDGLRTFFRL
jgi:VanZ family protein